MNQVVHKIQLTRIPGSGDWVTFLIFYNWVTIMYPFMYMCQFFFPILLSLCTHTCRFYIARCRNKSSLFFLRPWLYELVKLLCVYVYDFMVGILLNKLIVNYFDCVPTLLICLCHDSRYVQ